MVVMELQDVLRNVLGAYRVQLVKLNDGSSPVEISALDYGFRDQLYESFDYPAMLRRIVALLQPENALDYRDDFGLHYLVFQNRADEGGSYVFCGPFLYRSYTQEDFDRLLQSHGLEGGATEALAWYFKRVPLILDRLGWRQMLSTFLSRYLANPDLDIRSVRYDHPEEAQRKPPIALTSIPFASVEARYAV